MNKQERKKNEIKYIYESLEQYHNIAAESNERKTPILLIKGINFVMKKTNEHFRFWAEKIKAPFGDFLKQ